MAPLVSELAKQTLRHSYVAHRDFGAFSLAISSPRETSRQQPFIHSNNIEIISVRSEIKRKGCKPRGAENRVIL